MGRIPDPRFAGALCALALVAGLAAAPAHAAAVGRADAGSDVYDSECADCHSLHAGKNKKGPSLAGVIGRSAGTVAGYNYSDALARSGLVWTPDKLAAYIAAPRKLVPGGKMKYDDGGDITAQDIADLLAFLKDAH